MFRRMPFLKVLAIGQMVLLARRHFLQLDGDDRRRLRELVMRGKAMNAAERDELRHLLGKLEPAAFAFATADAFSPIPIPGRRWRQRRRR
jgi:hypothetical protein